MAVEGENLGTAAIYLTVDTTSMDAGIAKAKTKLAGMGADAEKQYVAMSASQRRVAEGLVKQAELINKTTAERIVYNAKLKVSGALGDEIAAKAIANAQAVTGATADATAAAKAADAAKAEMAAADDLRFKQIAADAMAEVEARQAVTAATMEQARANAVLAESRGAGAAGSAAQAIGALDSATVRQQMADYAALDAIKGKNVATTEQIIEANYALERLQAKGMISNEELAEAFAALDVAEAAETKSLQADSVAQVENAAATTINSRTQYELGIMLGEVASGNVNRLKRSAAALANSTGLLRAIMTPVGLAITGVIATLAAFGVAVADREKDLLALSKALAATGDFAGVTGLQLQGVAMAVGQSTGRYTDATKAVLALAQSGTVLGSDMQQMADTAVNMSFLTGQSVENVVKELIKLRGDPTQAIAKATSAMGLLTDAQYNQIVVTQQTQGVNAAAALAMKDLGEASDTARQRLVDNAGTVIRIWTNVKNMFGDIGRDIASIGAEIPVAIRVAQTQAKLARDLGIAASVNSPGDPNPVDPNKNQAVIEDRAKLAVLQQQQRTQAMFDAGQELANQAKQKHDEALAEALNSNKQGDEGFVAQAAVINGKRYAALVGIVDPSIRDRINAAYDQQIRDAVKRANSQYRGGSSGGRQRKDPGISALATLQSQVDGLTNKSIGVDGDAALTKYVQGVARLNDEFDKAIGKHANLTKAQAIYDEGMKALNATLAKNQAAQEADQKALRDASDAKIAAYKAQIALQVEAVGMGDKEIQRAQQLAQLQSQYADQLERLQEKAALHPDQKAAIDIQIANVTRERDAMVQATEQGYAQMDTAQSNWLNGAKAALMNFQDNAANIADQTKALFTTAFDDMTNALVTFVTTGKLNFKSLVTDFLAGIAKMEIQAAESKVFGLLANLAASYFGGGAAIDTNAVAAGNYTGPHAMGGVFNGPISPFANGGIVNSPRLFKFANGTGLMGEAGPEAVMPLSRGSNGQLGVRVHGGGGNVIVNVENHTDSKAQVSRSKDSSGNDMITVMINATANEVDRRIATGGSTAKAIQQRFGLSRAGVPVGA